MSIGKLVTTKMSNGAKRKASSWYAHQRGEVREIWHYSTLMALVYDGKIQKVSDGWGSVSDKCGWRKLSNAALAAGLGVID